MAVTTGIVIVSHSVALAAGVAELAGQMAPDVNIATAGGMETGELGTSYDLIERQITALLNSGLDGVVILTDLGSATLTTESVLEFLDDSRAILVDAPLVEGAVAAAVAAQTGGDIEAVMEAAQGAITQFSADFNASVEYVTEHGDAAETAISRVVTLKNTTGLHARPAAVIARIIGEHDATVTINGTNAASLLSMMALGIQGGAEVEMSAAGPDAPEVLDALAAQFDVGFNEP